MSNNEITKRVGRLIKVRPEYEERYVIIHKHVWPGVLERIKKSNIRNYSIFMLDGMLFSFNEYTGSNYDEDMKAVADDVTKDWWKLTDPMQEPLPSIKDGEWWADTEQVQYFNKNIKPYMYSLRFAYTAEIKSEYENKVKEQFKILDQSLADHFIEAGIQNHITYLRQNMLYMYFEFAGEEAANVEKTLSKYPDIKKWDDDFNSCLKFPWKEMKEVFHTD